MNSPAPQQKSAINILDYWKTLRQGFWTVLTVFTIVVAAISVWTLTQTPIYKSVATVEVRSQTQRVLSGSDVSQQGAIGFGWGAEERFYNTQIEILRSRDLAQRVLKKLSVSSDPVLSQAKDPVAVLSGLIHAQPRTDTQLIEISVTGSDPKWITNLANTVADEYVARNYERSQTNFHVILDGMQKEVERLSDTTKQADREKFQAAQDSGVILPEKQRDVLADQLSKLMQEHTQTQIEVARLQVALQTVEEVRKINGDLLTIPDIAKLDSVAQLSRQRSDLEKEIEGLRVSYLPSHPKLQTKVSELEALNKKIERQIDLTVLGWASEMRAKAMLEKDLAAQVSTTRTEIVDIGKKSSDYQIAIRDADTKAAVYTTIQSKLSEITVSSGLMTNNLSVLDRAIVPSRPIRPRKAMNLFLGAIVGLMAGIGAVFLLSHLDNTIRSIEEIEHGLNLPVLSIIPRYRETTGNAVKEAFQTLKTNVLFSSDARKRNLLLLTSAGPREGKSSTIVNLARTMASAGDRVVIVDCDLRRPTVHEHLQVERDNGLTNFLTGGGPETIDKYLKPTAHANLFALTCGPIPPNPPELFGGERFQEALRQLRSRFDWVLIDSPPVMSLTDSVILASMADMVAFVVKHNETDREMIRRSLQNIRNVCPHVIGAVLNNVDIEKSYSKDYYYTGYYNYAEGDRKKKRRRTGKIAEGEAPTV